MEISLNLEIVTLVSNSTVSSNSSSFDEEDLRGLNTNESPLGISTIRISLSEILTS